MIRCTGEDIDPTCVRIFKRIMDGFLKYEKDIFSHLRVDSSVRSNAIYFKGSDNVGVYSLFHRSAHTIDQVDKFVPFWNQWPIQYPVFAQSLLLKGPNSLHTEVGVLTVVALSPIVEGLSRCVQFVELVELQ